MAAVKRGLPLASLVGRHLERAPGYGQRRSAAVSQTSRSASTTERVYEFSVACLQFGVAAAGLRHSCAPVVVSRCAVLLGTFLFAGGISARAYTSNDVTTAFTSFTNIFYVQSGANAWIRN